MSEPNEQEDQTVYVALEQGTSEWLARILEPGKAPAYFVPSGIYCGISMTLKSVLCKAVNDAHGCNNVVFVSQELFNRKVGEQETAEFFLEEDPTLP